MKLDSPYVLVEIIASLNNSLLGHSKWYYHTSKAIHGSGCVHSHVLFHRLHKGQTTCFEYYINTFSKVFRKLL